VVGAHRARPLVRPAPQLARRPEDPPADAAGALRRDVQGRDRRLEAGRLTRVAVLRRRHHWPRSWTDATFWALFALVALIGFANAANYPPGNGYDAGDHMEYADGLIPGWHLPHGVGEYYTPPGFYFLAGIVDWLAEQAGLGDPHRATQALNVLLLLGTLL